jgi:hypothetical protein
MTVLEGLAGCTFRVKWTLMLKVACSPETVVSYHYATLHGITAENATCIFIAVKTSDLAF